MNIFKNLLFLHGHLTDPSLDDETEYGPTYGNRIASEKSFGVAYGRHDANAGRYAEALCPQGGCG